jgi:hypothetical protein
MMMQYNIAKYIKMIFSNGTHGLFKVIMSILPKIGWTMKNIIKILYFLITMILKIFRAILLKSCKMILNLSTSNRQILLHCEKVY